MLRKTTTRSAGNLPSDIAEDAEVRSGMSATTRSAKNLPSDMVIDSNGDGDDDETFGKSPFFKKSNRPMGYFTSLCSNADSAPFVKR